MSAVYVCQRKFHWPPVPAAAYDAHTDELVCRPCSGLDTPGSYADAWVTGYIPADLPATNPARPTIERR